MKSIILIVCLFGLSWVCNAQELDTQRNENFKNFCFYLSKVDSTKIDTSLLIKKYVDVSYITADTNKVRLAQRLKYLKLFSQPLKRSIGNMNVNQIVIEPLADIKDLDAKTLDQFKKMDGIDVFRFCIVQNGKKYSNWLAFRKGQTKVASWSLIDQGGYLYFLTLNLVGNRVN